jgi:hypothetical protein
MLKGISQAILALLEDESGLFPWAILWNVINLFAKNLTRVSMLTAQLYPLQLSREWALKGLWFPFLHLWK